MHIQSLQRFFNSSPAVRLIRSPHAFWIVDFLYQQFKLQGHITRLHSELATELDLYLDRLSQQNELVEGQEQGKKLWGTKDSREKADTYLAGWSSNSTGWLKRFIDEGAQEPSYQLTAEFEKALSFVEQASRQVAFVGTESRLKNILEILEDVVVGVAQDPQVRIQQLERQRDELNEQLEHLKSSPTATTMNATQVKERFWLASQQLQQLKSEFRAVEDRFKAITRGVQTKVMAAAESRGDILQYALDSEDMLKHGDQGQSFFEFLKLLHSPQNQDRISELIDSLAQVDALASEHDELSSLRSMVPTLISEAEKILRTTQHLSVTLRRLLDARATRHHQQLGQVLRDILSAATNQSEHPPLDVGLEVEVELEIQSAFDRPFWLATTPFEEVELRPAVVEPQNQARALQQLVSLERLDWSAMRQNIAKAIDDGPIHLSDLLDKFPVHAGAIEVLGYLQIAFDDGHRIDHSSSVELSQHHFVPSGGVGKRLNVPDVTFLPVTERQRPGRIHATSVSELQTP